MENNKLQNITVIVPVHQLVGDDNKLLAGALLSIREQHLQPESVLVVIANNEDLLSEVKTIVDESGLDNVSILTNIGETDYCTQVNVGVGAATTEFFSILEFDDEYSKPYFHNVKIYMEAYPETKGYLPIAIVTDAENKGLHYVNEGVWSQDFSDKLGFLDKESLLKFSNFIISGGVFSKEAFEEVGGLKSNIKVHFVYEFLLRYIHNDFTVMTIPKLGYKHMYGRVSSLFASYEDPTTGITPEESRFYLDAARKEYYFNPTEIKREIQYSANDSK